MFPVTLMSHGARAEEWWSLSVDQHSVEKVEESSSMKQELNTVWEETGGLSDLLTSGLEKSLAR